MHYYYYFIFNEVAIIVFMYTLRGREMLGVLFEVWQASRNYTSQCLSICKSDRWRQLL